MPKNTPHLITMNGGGVATIDGTAVALGGTVSIFVPNVSLYIFAYSKNNSPYRISHARFYSFKCTDTELEADVRDFIPVRFTNELGQSEGAMYDRVSGQLFRNAGTGSFVIGPDKE